MLAFVDDSGDEGTQGKGSRWLVFGCALVADADIAAAQQIAQHATQVAGRGQVKWIHFNEMTHDDKHGAIGLLTPAPWQGVIVASDTTAVSTGSHLYKPSYQYNYAARYVVERISARAAEVGEPATIYFEQRRNFDLVGFRQYIQRLINQDKLTKRSTPMIDDRWIDPSRIHEMPKRQDDTLCIADVLAYSAYRALEPHRKWGRYERSYLDAIIPKLWRGPVGKENLHVWGLVLMPTRVWGSKFVMEYPWLLDLPRT